MADIPSIPRHKLVELNKAINKVRAQAEAELMAIPGVIAVGVGLKESNGEYQPKLCFKVTVLKKKDKNSIPPAELIPRELYGFETDVNEVAPPKSGSLFLPDEEKYRPLIGGCQVQPSFTQSMTQGNVQIIISSTGTMGCLAKVNTGTHTGKVVGLTNWHVAVKGTAAMDGERTGQPTHNGCCTCCACNEIGKVIDARLSGGIDAAIFLLNGQDNDTTPDFRFVNEVLDIGILAGSAVHLAGEVVYKRGKTSGLTKGTITNDNFPTPALDYNTGFPDHVAIAYAHQLEITPTTPGTLFADHGDSGSVIVNTHNQVIGLLFAGDLAIGTGWAHPIADVTTALHIDIIDSTFHSSVVGKQGVPLTSAAFASEAFSIAAPFETLEKELLRYKTGMRFMELFKKHRVEILELVNNNREVMAAWNRYQGPAFLAQIIRSFHRNKPIEETIKGVRLSNLLLKMTAVLQRNGSEPLARAVGENYLQVMQVFTTGSKAEDWKINLEKMESSISG